MVDLFESIASSKALVLLTVNGVSPFCKRCPSYRIEKSIGFEFINELVVTSLIDNSDRELALRLITSIRGKLSILYDSSLVLSDSTWRWDAVTQNQSLRGLRLCCLAT